MPNYILGLVHSDSDANWRFNNHRRAVYHRYPEGAAPLMGVLSMMDGETTNDQKYTIYEKRVLSQQIKTVSRGSSAGPFVDATDPLTFTYDADKTAQTEGVHVDNAKEIRVGNVIEILNLDVDSSGTATVRGLVTAVNYSTNVVTFAPQSTVASIRNGTTNENVGKTVRVIGNAHAEAAVGSALPYVVLPEDITNYLQIFRTPFRISGSALKTELKWDREGPYKTAATDASLDHMVNMEKAFIFGRRQVFIDATDATRTYLMGGIMWYLEQWELGTVYGNNATAITLDTDPQKRIIENSGGLLSDKTYNQYLERLFRYSNNRAKEKLCLCGGQALNVLNQMYKESLTVYTDKPVIGQVGIDVVSHRTPFGTVHYKTHPLFGDDPIMQNSLLFLDVHRLKYRYFPGRDTELLQNRQPNNADYREEEWLTECGLEMSFPESHMLIKNVTDYTP